MADASAASKILAHRRTNSGTSLNVDFKARTQRDAEKALAVELDKLLLTAPAGSIREHYEQEFEIFKRVFQRFLSESGAAIDWDLIRPPPASMVVGYPSAMPTSREDAQSMLKRLAVVKLNGGLGTSMGCSGPKSLISVRNDLTFLDLHVQQIENLNKQYGVNVPLVLMNSFSTDDDTSRILPKYRNVGVTIDCFMQNQHPRIDKETLLPICKSLSGPDASDGAWCPSGHGAIYQSLYNSGMLKSLMDKGIEWIFVANIDNLGATIDLNILNSLFSQQEGQAYPEFVMEVTEKTAADVKGGTLVEYQGRLRLLEIAQVPKDHVDEFKSVSKFKIFNTNNLWINLAAIKRVVEEATLHMDIIVNPKMLDNGINVIQLEQAAGAAIKSFESPLGVVVPRSRFLPVKTSSDLLLVMSNLYNLKSGTLSMSLQRSFPSTPLVKLGVTFDKVKEFWKRFASIPDLMELHHLTVAGDVTFGKGVSLRGTVIIIANHGDRIDIPAGSVLENKIVSGNLRILDH